MIKTLLIMLTLTSLAIQGWAQAVVTDPGLTQLAVEEAAERKTIIARSIEQLTESIEQTQELKKTYDLAKKGYDALMEVNQLLQDLEMIQQAIDRQQLLIQQTQEMLDNFGREDIFSVEEYRKISNHLVDLVEGCSKILSMFDLIIQSGKTRMNDAERMQLILQINTRFEEKYAVTKSELGQYKYIYDQRKALEALQEMGTKMNR